MKSYYRIILVALTIALLLTTSHNSFQNNLKCQNINVLFTPINNESVCNCTQNSNQKQNFYQPITFYNYLIIVCLKGDAEKYQEFLIYYFIEDKYTRASTYKNCIETVYDLLSLNLLLTKMFTRKKMKNDD